MTWPRWSAIERLATSCGTAAVKEVEPGVGVGLSIVTKALCGDRRLRRDQPGRFDEKGIYEGTSFH
jgi:hypothetical protein